MSPHVSLQILGPLRLWRDGVELDAGPRQQAYLLALLLAHAGRPVSLSELIDLIWDDDVPATAVNIVQKYVGAIRRMLEPDLPPREPGSYLLRRGNGYLFTGPPGTVDITEFRDLVRQGDHVRAAGLWRGSVGAGLTPGPAAMPIFTAVNDEFLDACVTAARLAVSQGGPGLLLRPLRLAASMAPLHESVQAALVTVLGALGRQAEALSVHRAVRARLAEDLGVEPGPALRVALDGVLNGRPAPVARVRPGPPNARPDLFVRRPRAALVASP